METNASLKDTRWLAERLGLSVTTIERMRTEDPQSLPQHLKLGSVYRYDVLFVEWWLQKRLNPDLDPFHLWSIQNGKNI